MIAEKRMQTKIKRKDYGKTNEINIEIFMNRRMKKQTEENKARFYTYFH